jgi:hypothetical protein
MVTMNLSKGGGSDLFQVSTQHRENKKGFSMTSLVFSELLLPITVS